jgi:hypothetical protein
MKKPRRKTQKQAEAEVAFMLAELLFILERELDFLQSLAPDRHAPIARFRRWDGIRLWAQLEHGEAYGRQQQR